MPFRQVRVLISFPTRRSSDLTVGKPRPVCLRHLACPHRTTHRLGLRKIQLRPPAPTRAVELDFTETEAIDRKSTRLNSSHGYISYAVFCLKKKKQQKNLSQIH